MEIMNTKTGIQEEMQVKAELSAGFDLNENAASLQVSMLTIGNTNKNNNLDSSRSKVKTDADFEDKKNKLSKTVVDPSTPVPKAALKLHDNLSPYFAVSGSKSSRRKSVKVVDSQVEIMASARGLLCCMENSGPDSSSAGAVREMAEEMVRNGQKRMVGNLLSSAGAIMMKSKVLMTNPESILTMINTMMQHNQIMSEVNFLMEELLTTVSEEDSLEGLNAIVKVADVFFHSNPECLPKFFEAFLVMLFKVSSAGKMELCQEAIKHMVEKLKIYFPVEEEQSRKLKAFHELVTDALVASDKLAQSPDTVIMLLSTLLKHQVDEGMEYLTKWILDQPDHQEVLQEILKISYENTRSSHFLKLVKVRMTHLETVQKEEGLPPYFWCITESDPLHLDYMERAAEYRRLEGQLARLLCSQEQLGEQREEKE